MKVNCQIKNSSPDEDVHMRSTHSYHNSPLLFVVKSPILRINKKQSSAPFHDDVSAMLELQIFKNVDGLSELNLGEKFSP